MKVFAVAVIAFAICGTIQALPRDDKDIVEEIKETITKIFSFVPPEIGIKGVDIPFPHTIFFGGDFNITEAKISGMKDIEIKTLKFDAGTSRLDYEFNFKDIASVLDYAFDITGFFKMNHHFSAHIDIKDINTKGYAVINFEGDKIKKLTDFRILVTLGESDFDIKGFLNNEKLSEEISEALSKHVAQIFDKITPIISPIVSEFMRTAINIALDLFE